MRSRIYGTDVRTSPLALEWSRSTLPLSTCYWERAGVHVQVKMLPQSLESATERMMRADSIAREEAVFGNDFVEHFGGTRQHEVKLWNEAVTNWEGKHHSSISPQHVGTQRLTELSNSSSGTVLGAGVRKKRDVTRCVRIMISRAVR